MPTPRAPRPATRPVVHYVPVDTAPISPYPSYELAVRQAEQRLRHEQWKIRHDEQVARDRANRRIIWPTVIAAGLLVLAAVAFVVWQLLRAMAAHADTVLGGGVLLVAACVLVPVLVGGGCKTVITIRHSRR